MLSFAEYAIRGIQKYPEIFSALEEFERTKKIPKFTYRKRIDITINEHIEREFRKQCEQQGSTMSRKIEEYMKQEIEKIKRAKSQIT